MTQSEFIKDYCERSKMTEKQLNKLGLFSVPCNCSVGKSIKCNGWTMITRENLKTHIDLYVKNL